MEKSEIVKIYKKEDITTFSYPVILVRYTELVKNRKSRYYRFKLKGFETIKSAKKFAEKKGWEIE